MLCLVSIFSCAAPWWTDAVLPLCFLKTFYLKNWYCPGNFPNKSSFTIKRDQLRHKCIYVKAKHDENVWIFHKKQTNWICTVHVVYVKDRDGNVKFILFGFVAGHYFILKASRYIHTYI